MSRPVSRSSRRHDLPVVVASAIVVTLLAITCLRVVVTVHDLRLVHDRYESMNATAREQAAGSHEGFAAADWEFLRHRLAPGDRYLLVTPAGGARGEVNLGFVTRSYADYFLLPAVQVSAREDATAVVYVNARAPAGAECSAGGRSVCIVRLSR